MKDERSPMRSTLIVLAFLTACSSPRTAGQPAAARGGLHATMCLRADWTAFR